MPNKISIIKPDDWHLHLREGDILKKVLKYSAKNFSRALIMPNLKKPILTYAQAEKYRREILKYLPKGSKFNPLMTLYLTEKTNPKDIKSLKVNELISAIKYYPSGATTNSTYGVKNFEKVMPVMEQMAKFNIPLCIHGELPGENYDIFDREKIFIEKVLDKIRS
ncbi:MAG: dihydroorotase, partial [Rhodobacteraceae bacterium]